MVQCNATFRTPCVRGPSADRFQIRLNALGTLQVLGRHYTLLEEHVEVVLGALDVSWVPCRLRVLLWGAVLKLLVYVVFICAVLCCVL